MHVAVLDRERCHPKKCNHECQYYCPPVRSGTPTIEFPDPNSQPVINEPLCIGCGICVHRCPFGAIKIITLPDELNKDLSHQYGLNSFRLYSLPIPLKGKVSAILGQNALGKSTTLKILSGVIVPNFGNYEEKPSRENVVRRFAGSVLGDYFRDLYDGNHVAVLKDQNVDLIPKVTSGTIGEILKRDDPQGKFDEIVSSLGLSESLDKDVSYCSGGELQKLAVGRALMKDGDIYLFDETTSYLDISERLRVARLIQELSASKIVFVVEHDLAIMDWMADNAHIVYGQPGAYGIVSEPRTSNKAINSFLEGYLREENVRIRNYAISFQKKSSKRDATGIDLSSWSDLKVNLGNFRLNVSVGSLKNTHVVGVLGRNALGKSTFARVLAGVIKDYEGILSNPVRISYKPQYISTDYDGTVLSLFHSILKQDMENAFVRNEIIHPLDIESLYDENVQDLSGGELQRMSICLTLSRDADLYILDEPSAHLDSAYRMLAAKVIKRVMENNKKGALVIDHDVYFIDLISDELMIFTGMQGVEGNAFGPMPMTQGMNTFLKEIEITFRRDALTMRPRINKPNSRLDKEQKESGNYYYAE